MTTVCIILNYNDSHNTCDLALSIKDFRVISHIVIVDNFSSDSSYSDLEHLVGEKISLLKTDRNGGYSFGNNFGINYSSKFNPDIIIVANPDIKVSEMVLTASVDFLSNQTDVALVAPYVVDINGSKTLEPAWKMNEWFIETLSSSALFGRLLWKKTRYSLEELSVSPSRDVDILPGSLLIADYSKFKEVGFFDENTFLYCEERILAFKLLKKQYRSILLTTLSYVHHHSTSISKEFKKEYVRKKIWLKSRKYYIVNYHSSSAIRKTISSLLFLFFNIELFFVSGIRLLARKHR